MLPWKAPLLMRPRGTGRAVAVEDSLSLIRGCSCHQVGQAAGPERTPARKRCGPASDAVRQMLARPRNRAGVSARTPVRRAHRQISAVL